MWTTVNLRMPRLIMTVNIVFIGFQKMKLTQSDRSHISILPMNTVKRHAG